MSLMQPHIAVTTVLRPIERFLNRRADDVIEVSINREKEVWVKMVGRGYVRESEPLVTLQWAENFCHVLSNATGRTFSKRKPLLSCSLPPGNGGHRVQGLTGPNVGSGMAISIRLKRMVDVPWGAFGIADDGALRPPPVGKRGHLRHLAHMPLPDLARARQDLEAIMRAGGSGLVIGATETGKTTFLNKLLQFLPPHLRLITIEDVSEVRPPHENWVQLLVARTETGTDIGYAEIIDCILRFNPDALVCSELSVHNIEGVVRLLNTGHGSFWSTAHANSALDGLEAIRRNYELATGRDASGSLGYIASCFDRIVGIEAIDGDDGRSYKHITELVAGHALDWRSLPGASRNSDIVQALRDVWTAFSSRKKRD
jgi:type IV secretory pathway ATPase VirB11/archaellum biosynthesis ATPase